MAKYHLSPDGTARICTAKSFCPLGDAPHRGFDSEAEARTWAEEELAKEYVNFAAMAHQVSTIAEEEEKDAELQAARQKAAEDSVLEEIHMEAAARKYDRVFTPEGWARLASGRRGSLRLMNRMLKDFGIQRNHPYPLTALTGLYIQHGQHPWAPINRAERTRLRELHRLGRRAIEADKGAGHRPGNAMEPELKRIEAALDLIPLAAKEEFHVTSNGASTRNITNAELAQEMANAVERRTFMEATRTLPLDLASDQDSPRPIAERIMGKAYGKLVDKNNPAPPMPQEWPHVRDAYFREWEIWHSRLKDVAEEVIGDSQA